jgi:hypothetical protein
MMTEQCRDRIVGSFFSGLLVGIGGEINTSPATLRLEGKKYKKDGLQRRLLSKNVYGLTIFPQLSAFIVLYHKKQVFGSVLLCG